MLLAQLCCAALENKLLARKYVNTRFQTETSLVRAEVLPLSAEGGEVCLLLGSTSIVANTRSRNNGREKNFELTQESGADVLGNLVARPARFGEVAQLFVQHAFELQSRKERCISVASWQTGAALKRKLGNRGGGAGARETGRERD